MEFLMPAGEEAENIGKGGGVGGSHKNKWEMREHFPMSSFIGQPALWSTKKHGWAGDSMGGQFPALSARGRERKSLQTFATGPAGGGGRVCLHSGSLLFA